jgi:hypothetical protein
MKHWLKRHEWTLVGAVAVFAFVIGAVGMRLQLAAQGAEATWADAAYFSLRLFTFEYDLGGEGSAPYAASNWLLQVARFLAPTTLTYAVVMGLLVAAAYQFNLWRLSRWKGHAVVCGAGERGRRLAVALRKEGRRVVVIEKDEQVDTLADIRAAGARVVMGSGTDPARQTEARLAHAAIVAAVTPWAASTLRSCWRRVADDPACRSGPWPTPRGHSRRCSRRGPRSPRSWMERSVRFLTMTPRRRGCSYHNTRQIWCLTCSPLSGRRGCCLQGTATYCLNCSVWSSRSASTPGPTRPTLTL